MPNNQRLELTWVGKDDQPKLEPRILIEDSEKSYGNKNAENMLIFGDNLLALKALEQDFAGKIKCIYIDPPFNTGSAFEHYDDGIEHSIWLNLIRERLEILKRLLSFDGVLMLHLDDSEMAYAKVLCDEVFGRNAHLNTISMTTNDPSGFKATSMKIFSTANYILIYAKGPNPVELKRVFIEKDYDDAYSKVLENRNDPIEKWMWANIKDVVAKENGFQNPVDAINNLGESEFQNLIANFAINNASPKSSEYKIA